MEIIVFIITTCFGYFIYLIGGSPYTGQESNWSKFKSIKIPLKIKENEQIVLHLHHWIYLTFFIVFNIYYKLFSGLIVPILHGACTGGVIHGLRYNDWNNIIYESSVPKM